MSATSFTADLRDIRFVLFEQLDITGTLSKFEPFADLDNELCDSMIDEAYRISQDVLGPANKNCDRQGCRFDGEGNVKTPDGFKEAWEMMSSGGWFALSAPLEHGGMGMPNALAAGVGELFTAACMSFALYPGLTRAAANLLVQFGAESYRGLVCERMFSGQWAGTMCLTEPGAGSSVGDNRTRATPTEGGAWNIEGEKIFISSGDHDLTENIMHLVLARTPGAPAGTKGLSLFLVPKFMFDEEGNLGERNGAFASGIEEKMGLHGSATCSLVFGADGPCAGYLIGEECKGIQIMFMMMNEARLEVGFQGLAGAAAAYQNSLHYARERVQGTDIRKFGDPSAPRVAIIEHPDVRRMLMWQKVHVETMRSLIYETTFRIDVAHATEDETLKAHLEGQIALLTPIIKAYCSDKGFDSTVIALQVLGGYGYTGEYPVEQHVRDTKIASIYEGTNGIQAMDLLGRKMRKGSGALFMAWLGDLNKELDAARNVEALSEAVGIMEKARDSLGASAMHLAGMAMQNKLPGAMLQATPFLDQFGCILLGLHAITQARIASEKLADAEGADLKYYRGKILNAQFYATQLLPRAVALGKSIRSNDESCLDEALF
ncbi:MAG: alkylation response protein AidB-like acyl-CoA dehydrogenase [Myxococcota bacterium]|jgi:alkylation response protein AidB-like acyl-CoA dehydrogenase